MRRFEDYCYSTGLSKKRSTIYILALRKLAEWPKKGFDEVSKEDIERLVNRIERRDY